MRTTSEVRVFRNRISRWGHENVRDFPWRRTCDPYALLVAEVLLQHTSAQQVSSSFPMFMRKFSTASKLARACVPDIERVIKRLGKLHRARDLKKMAIMLLDRHKGKVPSTLVDLLELPGIGRYSAAAVLNAAFGEGLPVVDSNISRVFRRFFLTSWSAEDIKRKPEPLEFTSTIIPKTRTHQFNLYMLDFAALVCVDGKPNCQICPLFSVCPSRIEDS